MRSLCLAWTSFRELNFDFSYKAIAFEFARKTTCFVRFYNLLFVFICSNIFDGRVFYVAIIVSIYLIIKKLNKFLIQNTSMFGNCDNVAKNIKSFFFLLFCSNALWSLSALVHEINLLYPRISHCVRFFVTL